MRIALLTALLLIASAVSAQTLGSVKSVQGINCPPGGLSGAQCYKLVVSCPSVADHQVRVKVNQPTGASLGTVAFISGTGGIGFDDTVWTYGATMVGDVRSAGFLTAQTNWQTSQTDHSGWLTGPGGIKALACRPATVLQWVQTDFSAPLECSTGTSGGAAALAYALSWYGMNFNFAELTSGPPMSRVDWGCDNTQPPAYDPATGATNTLAYIPAAAIGIIDVAYTPNTYCISELQAQGPPNSTQYDGILLPDSVMANGANLSFSTPTHFLYGGLDPGNPPVQGYLYEQAIGSTHGVVADAPHEIGQVLDGAQQIASDIIAGCQQSPNHTHPPAKRKK